MLAALAALALALVAHAAAPAGDPADARMREEAAAFERARSGDHAGSTERLEVLLAAAPASERACLWRERIFLNTIDGGDDAAMWAAAEALVDSWLAIRERADLRAPLVRVCRDDVASTLRYLAARWHYEAILRTCELVSIERAVIAYRRYLELFPGGPGAYEVSFYLAHALYRGIYLSTKPPGQGCVITCGNAAWRAEEARRARGEPPPSCDPKTARDGELAMCPWMRAARDAFREVLERDPAGRHTEDAAYAQLALTLQMAAYGERERIYECRTNKNGECVVRGTWRSPCSDRSGSCVAPTLDPERWPSVSFGGYGSRWPPWRTP
ncbi:MAG: hypothetical protein H6710_24725 [Myxococcales bacterium]|nr:hypothetical protein [Myxococcales bacterium]